MLEARHRRRHCPHGETSHPSLFLLKKSTSRSHTKGHLNPCGNAPYTKIQKRLHEVPPHQRILLPPKEMARTSAVRRSKIGDLPRRKRGNGLCQSALQVFFGSNRKRCDERRMLPKPVDMPMELLPVPTVPRHPRPEAPRRGANVHVIPILEGKSAEPTPPQSPAPRQGAARGGRHPPSTHSASAISQGMASCRTGASRSRAKCPYAFASSLQPP
jgi:hypothetical protein